MKFPMLVFCVFCGGILVTGGTLMGKPILNTGGIIFWIAAGGILIAALWTMARNAWIDHKVRKRMRWLRDPQYRPGRGLR